MSRATQVDSGNASDGGTGLSPSAAGLSSADPPARHVPKNESPTTPRARRHAGGLGSSPFARHYWGNHCCFLLLGVLRCFSSPGSPPRRHARMPAQHAGGLSHSEIRASRDMCSSARLIAAYHVLHRLCEPRHPPCALSYFLYSYRRPACEKKHTRDAVCILTAASQGQLAAKKPGCPP